MMKFVALLLITMFMIPTLKAAPLLTANHLANIYTDNNVRIIDIRSTQAYAQNHIPGSVSAPYAAWRGPESNPGQLPAIRDLQTLVRQLGIKDDSHVIVVSAGSDSTNFGAMARVYWTLKYLGLKHLSILNGGFKAWKDADLSLDQAPTKMTASDFHAHLDKSIIANSADVARQLGNDQTLFLDARPHDFYLGKTKAPAATVAGTLPGAVNLENAQWFKPGTAQFISKDQAERIAEKNLSKADRDKATVSFCNTGHWAASNWFALSEVLGQKNVRLYPGSMVDWSHQADHPIENEPGRGAQLWSQIKGIVK